MVVFVQNGCISSKNGCVLAKVVVFEQSGFIQQK